MGITQSTTVEEQLLNYDLSDKETFVDDRRNPKNSGYLTQLEIADRDNKNLPPMLAITTGKDSVGKTRVLESILSGFEDNLRNKIFFWLEDKLTHAQFF